MRAEHAVLLSHNSDDWQTDVGVFRLLDSEFGFDFDPCPLRDNLAFVSHWGRRAFVNPPYSDIRRFMEKALLEIGGGRTDVAVFLVPSRTDTRWWHEIVLPKAKEIRFVKGRLRFKGEKNPVGKNPAPFASCIIVFEKEELK